MSNFIVCAFFTDQYASQVASLEQSVSSFGIEFYKKHYKSRGFWEANTRIKPEFLLQCLDDFKGKDVLYLDADSVMKRYPDLLRSFEGDVGVYCSSEAAGFTHSYLTGTLYLRNNERVRHFLKCWIDSQGGKPTDVDQDGFQRAVKACPDIGITPLPPGYTKIFDRADMAGEVVIEHYQASRRQVKLGRVLNRVRDIFFVLLLVVLIFSLFRYFVGA